MRQVRGHMAIFSETGVENGHTCWNVVFGSISSTSLTLSGTSRASRKNDLRAGTVSEARLTSTLVRWWRSLGCISMRPHSGKREATSEPILAC